MKNELGISLLEVVFCLTLISISVLGIAAAKHQAMTHSELMRQKEFAFLLADKQLRYWQFCGARSSSSSIDTCGAFTEISSFSKEIPPYAMTVNVTPVRFTADGPVSLKKVRIEVSWQVSAKEEEVQKIEVSSAFSRHNLFSSLH